MSTKLPLLLLCLFGAAGCADDGPAHDHGGTAGAPSGGGSDFSLGLTEESDDGMFSVRILEASPAPPQKFENDWVVEVLDSDGEAMADAEMYFVEPFMPAHGHDGGFQPDIEAVEGSPGQYAVSRINLWMGGDWEVRFFVRDGEAQEDRAVIDVFIED